MVLFVLGIVYVTLFFLTLQHTSKRLIRCCFTKSTTFMKIFSVFYWCILLQLALTSTLYWVYFAKIIEITQDSSIYVSAIALIFLPTILMIIGYSLLYY